LKKLIKIIDKPIPYPSLRLPFTMLYKWSLWFSAKDVPRIARTKNAKTMVILL
jgi:hypothetical protein